MSGTHGTIHWNELNARDLDKAKTYYEKICGWTWQAMPMEDGSDYHIAMRGEEMVAGLFDISGMAHLDKVPAHWMTYFAVVDVDAAAKETVDLGGSIIREPFDVPEVGRFAIVVDSAGAAMGLITPPKG